MSGLPIVVDADAVRAALTPLGAVNVIEAALRGGLDPGLDLVRSAIDVTNGQVLLMPSAGERHVGVKIVGIAPGNRSLDLPRIHATYLLMHAITLQPVAVLDGTALTALRTPAVSIAAVRSRLVELNRPAHVVVFGAGPQGVGHLETVSAVIEIGSATLVVREPAQVRMPSVTVLATSDAGVAPALRDADIVVCATTSRRPLFDSSLLGEDVVVIAVGSHEPTTREVDSDFLARATVVVEDVETALREAGDVVLAVEAGVIAAADLVPMRDIVTGAAVLPAGPVLFKGTGMSWQDLVVAEAILVGHDLDLDLDHRPGHR